MSQYEHKKWCNAVNTADGTVIAADENGYVTLAVGTYVVPLGTRDGSALAAQIQTDAAIAASGITLEHTVAPTPSSKEPGAATDWTVAADSPWVKDDSAVNASLASNGTGWTATVLSMVKTAGIGNAIWNLACRSAPRYRMRLVVTTGGKARINWHCKT